MTTVAAIHTATPMIEPTKELFAEHLPGVRLINIVDDSLIQDVIRNNKVTPGVKKRLISYYYAAIDAGADIIFNTCSSVGETAIAARVFLPVPVVKIDDEMARQAVKFSNRIGVLATLTTTLGPTCRLVESMAIEAGISVKIKEGLAEGAFQAVISGNKDLHDQLIMKRALEIAADVDVIVLAQGSMARMEQALSAATGKRVLSSPLYGVLSVAQKIKEISKG
ncbi:MAG: aspartate/glutamate racemase family protein [Bacteroidales bacterium]|jgi:aspartate/glutamate racemase|nr:aspartate/glutamate racemase family protein [Bacteroidales bacterium]